MTGAIICVFALLGVVLGVTILVCLAVGLEGQYNGNHYEE